MSEAAGPAAREGATSSTWVPLLALSAVCGGMMFAMADPERSRRPRSSLLDAAALARRSSNQRIAIGLIGLAVIGVLGYLDYVTSAVVSLAVLYVLVVVAVTLMSGLVAGMACALASSVSWVVGDAALSDFDARAYVANGALRLAALTIVVLLVERLVEALVRARESELRSREFLATAAHQLRTPIAGVRASADALFHVDATPEQERLLGNLVGESVRAGRLINSLLRVARLDQGEPMRPESVGLDVVAAGEVDRAQVLTPVPIRFVSGGRARVLIDVHAIREAIANLLDNARHHASTEIEVRVEARDRVVALVVRDDGPGVPAGFEERVFDRFVSLGGGGSGLGLSIARQLVRIHGGDIEYTDSAFVLTLPVDRGPVEHVEPDASGRLPTSAD